MVDFAGYSMPVQYDSLGIVASHLHTRQHSSIFDVSHMLQTYIFGKDKIKFMESLCVADVQGLKPNQGSLSVFTNAKGGIIDDLIVTRSDEQNYLYLVTNAGCRDADIPLMKAKEAEMKSQGLDVTLEFQEERGLIALQGPESAKALQELTPQFDLSKLTFMTSIVTSVDGVGDCRVTRCGYTGEDGFEISIPDKNVVSIVEKLLTSANVELAGLGARDSLRLEAGLCLYGNDIDEKTTPVEAGLTWTIGKRRRTPEAATFPGSQIILDQIKAKPQQKRVGLITKGGPPARSHTEIRASGEESKIGEITSGCPAPSLPGKQNVAMAYVPAKYAKIGTKLDLVVRKKKLEAEVVKMPFVPAKYYMGS